jgi:TolB-like protein/tetratricopeptide (TPR) repeat protein
MAATARKLAAIVSIDIAGYSALAERDASGALEEVTRLRGRAEGACTRFGGRIFNTAGDGLMLEFATASDALYATLALLELEPRIRVGVHIGEVAQAADGDLLGHDVNVAARLQAEAGIGAALISKVVRDSAAPELASQFAARGKVKLAKMRDVISVFAFSPAAAPPKRSDVTPVLAVLAFDSATRDHASRRLAEGVSEEILFAVSRIPGVKVIGSTSSFAFRGREKARAGKALNASHVLDGIVRRNDETLRINVTLTEAESGIVLWSERYQPKLAEALSVEEDIAEAVAKALEVTFGEAKRARAPKLTAALSDAYFEAREMLRSGGTLCIQTAAAGLDRIVLDAPDFGRAWAALASAKLEVLRLARADRAKLANEAREAAERALGVDPSMGEPYAVLAALEAEFFGRWRERETLLERALGVEPHNPHILFRHGQFLIATGRVKAGYRRQAEAFALDPLDPMLAAFHGYNLWAQGEKDSGRGVLNDAAKRYPDNVFVWYMRLNTAALDGDFALAQALREDGKRLLPGLTDSATFKAGARMQELMMAPSPEAFMKLGEDFTAMAEAEPAAALDLAVVLAILGFTGPALSIFGEALDNIDAWRMGALEAARPHIGYETALLFLAQTQGLRMDAAFPELCARLGLARYWRESSAWPDCAEETPYDFKAACAA